MSFIFTNQDEWRPEEGIRGACFDFLVRSGNRDATAAIGSGQALVFRLLLGQAEGRFPLSLNTIMAISRSSIIP
jgi:hypothetical protein